MRDLLAVTDRYKNWGHSLRYAGELAALLDAHLTGMFIVEPIMPYSPSPLPVVTADMYSTGAETARAAEAAGPEFEKFIASTRARHGRWLVGRGSFAASVAHAANWHDLLVVGSATNSAWGSAGTLGQLLLTCDLPCIVVPESSTRKATLDTIAIAWNGSSECARAMHAALPLIKRARQVLLLAGAQKEIFSEVAISPPFSPEEHLRQHGIGFSTTAFEATAANAGAALLRAAEDAQADLLIMGAYGRTRLSEWVLGGATRHMLQHTSLPVLMRH